MEFPTISNPDASLVVRTDYSNEEAWRSLCDSIEQQIGDYQALVEYFDDSELSNLTEEQIRSIIPHSFDHGEIFIADQISLEHPEHPILVVDLAHNPGRTFRVIPTQMWAVQNNLSLANMDFVEFKNSADEDGIFRGF